MDVYELLHHVKSGAISIEDAAGQLKHLPYENLGFAKIDHHRKLRQGFEEVIYCSGKSLPHLVRIYTHMAEEGIEILGTRASQEQYEAVSAALPEVTYDPISRILKRHRPRNFSEVRSPVCMMWELPAFTGFFPICLYWNIPAVSSQQPVWRELCLA